MLKMPFRLLQLLSLVFLMGVSSLSLSQAILTKIGSSFPMFNGSDLSAWTQTGNANWQVSSNQLLANQGSGLLISKLTAPDYQIDFDYWVTDNSQAVIFIRCTNKDVINTDTAYQISLVNRDNSQGAGSIATLNNVAATIVANQWNHMQISVIGSQISVTLNGVNSQVTDTRFGSGGRVAINYQAGELRLKNFNITIPGRW
jgi:hypothetical protein